MTNPQEAVVAESCLDWLITEKIKVATQAYSIRVVYEISKRHESLYADLQRMIIINIRHLVKLSLAKF
ncbi:hypothetical protein [Flavobacterium segetis]|uniref:hypothetical protein n=1 Tax=Flavobacterium segetis TaxID=271157 RepID=UPI0009322A8B|nr:hypothetical protein [Flavobacterium segetis]